MIGRADRYERAMHVGRAQLTDWRGQSHDGPPIVEHVTGANAVR
jgi:hypothetical protein